MNRTRRDFLKVGGATAITAGMGGTAGCMSVLGARAPNTVKVSSARFPESILLSYMAIESLRANTDLTVLDETALGGVGMNFRAVENAETTLFWLYTGGAWVTIPPQKEEVITDQKKLYRAAKEKMRRVYGLAYLNRAPFNNTYILIATREWVRKTGVTTMTEFAAYVTSGNTGFTVVMGPEFRTRPDGWPGLAKHYDFAEAASKLNIRNVGASLTYQVVAEGGADVGVGFSTNPNIRRYGLETIADDRTFSRRTTQRLWSTTRRSRRTRECANRSTPSDRRSPRTRSCGSTDWFPCGTGTHRTSPASTSVRRD